MGGGRSKPKPVSLPEFLKDPEKEPPAKAASDLAKKMTSAAVQLAGGEVVAGAIAKTIYDEYWSGIFPPHDAVSAIHDIQKVVGEALEAGTIKEINAKLSTLQSELKQEYGVKKKHDKLSDPSARKDLYDILETLNNGLSDIIETLKQPKYAEIGLMHFLLLAGFRLALYQEMANVDPSNKSLDPKESVYAAPYDGVVATSAKEYANHAEKYWHKAVAHRKGMFSVTRLCDGGGKIDDKATTGQWKEAQKESIESFAARYWAEQKKIFEEKFANPEEVIANWRKLMEVPINVHPMMYSGMILTE